MKKLGMLFVIIFEEVYNFIINLNYRNLKENYYLAIPFLFILGLSFGDVMMASIISILFLIVGFLLLGFWLLDQEDVF